MADQFIFRAAQSGIDWGRPHNRRFDGPLSELCVPVIDERAEQIWQSVRTHLIEISSRLSVLSSPRPTPSSLDIASLYGNIFWGKGDATQFGYPDRLSYFKSLSRHHPESVRVIELPFVRCYIELFLPWLNDGAFRSDQFGMHEPIVAPSRHKLSSVVIDFAGFVGYSLVLPLSAAGHDRYLIDNVDPHDLRGADLAEPRLRSNATKLRSLVFEDIAVATAAPHPLTDIRLDPKHTITPGYIEQEGAERYRQHIRKIQELQRGIHLAGIPLPKRVPQVDLTLPMVHAIRHIESIFRNTDRDPACKDKLTPVYAETGRAMGFRLVQEMTKQDLIPPRSDHLDSINARPDIMATYLGPSAAEKPKPRWMFPAEYLEGEEVSSWLNKHDGH